MLDTFWRWYERTYTVHISVAFGLFALQLTHLAWLFGEVVWLYLTGHSLFVFEGVYKWLIVLIDYTEVPAILSVSLVYIHELRQRWSGKDALYLLFLNSQWLHLFWITDEFVETTFNSSGTVLPMALAWLAVLIDYLEVPVMFDTAARFFCAMRPGGRA